MKFTVNYLRPVVGQGESEKILGTAAAEEFTPSQNLTRKSAVSARQKGNLLCGACVRKGDSGTHGRKQSPPKPLHSCVSYTKAK